MPRAQPPKKMQRSSMSILDFFPPKKQTDHNIDARETPQTCDNDQENMDHRSNTEAKNGHELPKEKMGHFCKAEDKDGLSKSHLQQEAEWENHTFQFCYEKEKYSLVCDPSFNVLDALNKSDFFKNIKSKKNNTEKEVLIQRRSKGGVPTAAVKTDFPSCLFEKDEIIDVTFIKNDGNASTKAKPTAAISCLKTPEKFVTFYIKKKGGEKVKRLLKSNALMREVDYVCVYALKVEKQKKIKVKTALKRDGRFINVIYKKQCALSEFGSKTIHALSHPVEHLDGKVFQVVVVSDTIQIDSQEDFTPVHTESIVASENAVQENGSGQNQDKSEKETPQNGNTKSTNSSPKRCVPESIPNSEEILKILRNQYKDLLQTLKEREQLRDKPQVQKFFRAEYDKSVQSFTEVKKVKRLMELSESVCLIMVEDSPKGTGFLLFDRFILTNAHVIGDFDPFSRKLSKPFTAAFGNEDLEQNKIKRVSIKEHVIAYFNGTNDMNVHLDYALLELNIDEMTDYPKLLSRFNCGPTPNRGGICIVGHPGGGVKRMDPCFIIARENRQEAETKHLSENVEFIHVITQKSIAEKWDIHENQITYDSCFFHGSSGSPVFDEDCYLIGMHTGGYVYPGKGKFRSVMEYAYSMQSIMENVIKQVINEW
ncbi:serine protease FAM111A-like [Xyrauchen texanus]|uniref:serine protease FAM111A-like n=1 Tax=Xyrauchen texanus TaxID=154827 RepID=UPI002241D0C6|nr:serine protease FAM111A-like [Xyrauchen texanus]